MVVRRLTRAHSLLATLDEPTAEMRQLPSVTRPPAATRHPTPISSTLGGDPQLAAFIQLVNRIRLVPGVEKIRFTTSGDRVQVWVLTRTEDLEANRQIFRIEQDFRAAQAMSRIALRVIPLSEMAEEDLPSAEQVYPETA